VAEEQLSVLYAGLARQLTPGGVALTCTRPQEVDYPLFTAARQVRLHLTFTLPSPCPRQPHTCPTTSSSNTRINAGGPSHVSIRVESCIAPLLGCVGATYRRGAASSSP
jgi:hypothetical protein